LIYWLYTLDIDIGNNEVIGLKMESITNISRFISTKYGLSNNFGRKFMEMIKALRSNVTTDSGSNGFTKVTNEIGD
jgi:hypothetical protein